METGAMTAFFFDQDTPRNANYCDHIKSLAEVEAASGLDLFPQETSWPTGNLNAALGCT